MGPGGVSGVVGYGEIPDAIRALGPVVQPDYADLFSAGASRPAGTSLEQWLQEVFSGGPALVRLVVPLVQRGLLGLRLHRPLSAPGYLFGWKIADGGDEWIRLEVDSWLICAHLVGVVSEERVALATFVRYEHALAAFIWPVAAVAHRRVARSLMRRATAVPTHELPDDRVVGAPQPRAGSVASQVGSQMVPDSIRRLTTLVDPNYVDHFVLTTPSARAFSAEEWARAVLEQSPLARRNARTLWRLMGLRLGPPRSPVHVQGWRISARGDSWLRAETASWYMTAQAVCLVEEGQVSVSLSLRYDRPVAVLVWAVVSGPHRRAVPVMLRQALRVVGRSPSGQSRHEEQHGPPQGYRDEDDLNAVG